MKTFTIAILVLLLIPTACSHGSRWRASTRPTPAQVETLLAPRGASELWTHHDIKEAPVVPVRERLRPCCGFGSDIGVKVGPIPVPGFKIPNVQGLDDLGNHTYDSGRLHALTADAEQDRHNSEENGLVYTCRGGFIDTAHVRDYVDWSFFVGTMLERHYDSGGTFPLPDEGGTRTLIFQNPDPDLIAKVGVRRLTVWLAQWITFQMSIWHEIATWYGWQSVPGFSERASAFSPEDLYSNLLGVRLIGAIGYRRGGASERLFNKNVDLWFAEALEALQAVPREVGVEAMESVEGLWWDSSRRLPDAALIQRRNMEIGPEIGPWLIPEGRMGPELRAACVDAPEPHPLWIHGELDGVTLADLIALEIEVDENLAAQEPFRSIGTTLTEADFPKIVEVIREQAHVEFGPRADRRD